MHRSTLIGSLLLASALSAQPIPLPPPTPLTEPEPPRTAVVTDVALVYSPAEGETGIVVEPWDASGPTVGGGLGARVDYFTVEPAAITLAVGQNFSLGDFSITAHGLNGNTVERAPLKVSLEAFEGLIDIDLALADQRLLATQRGIGRLWIESLLPRGTGTGEHYRLPIVIVVR